MRWTKKQKYLIMNVIRRYKRERKKPEMKRNVWKLYLCPFCLAFVEAKCGKCPNVIITKILDIDSEAENQGSPCFLNASYTNTYGSREKQITLRIEFWKDALKLTPNQFKKKWEHNLLKEEKR